MGKLISSSEQAVYRGPLNEAPAEKGVWVDTDWALTPRNADAEVHEDSQITSGRTSKKNIVENPKETPGFGVDEFCVDKVIV